MFDFGSTLILAELIFASTDRWWPGSLLASKMVKEGFGVPGHDLAIGAEILCRAALDEAFADGSGKYYDNDAEQFALPHAAAQDPEHVRTVMQTLQSLLTS